MGLSGSITLILQPISEAKVTLELIMTKMARNIAATGLAYGRGARLSPTTNVRFNVHSHYPPYTFGPASTGRDPVYTSESFWR